MMNIRTYLGGTHASLALLVGVISLLVPLSAHSQQRMLWYDADDKVIYRANIDGSNRETLTVISGENVVTSIAVDDIGQKIYFALPGTPAIERMNFDGTGRETLTTNSAIHQGALVVDPIGQRLYYSGVEQIISSNLDGTGEGTVYQANGPVVALAIDPDPVLSTVFWAEEMVLGEHTLHRSFTDVFIPNPLTTTNFVRALTFDSIRNKLFWTVGGISGQGIHMASASGGDESTLLDFSPPADPYQIAVDFPEENLYWADSQAGGILKSSISNPVAQLVTASSFPYALALDCGKHAPDSDLDGAADCRDGCPSDQLKISPGACGCNVAETDSDGDGTPDCIDACPADNLKAAPGVCGCGVSEADADGDGAPNCIDSCPADAAKTSPGACGCGAADDDVDGDGSLSCTDGCTFDKFKVAPGICGCGVPDVDTDGDGAFDCNDECPSDVKKVSALSCGCGFSEFTAKDGSTVCSALRELSPSIGPVTAPEVRILDRNVLVILERFSGIRFDQKKKKKKRLSALYARFLSEAATRGGKLTPRYDLSLSSSGISAKVSLKTSSKSNEYVYKNLKPGNYSVSYRVSIVKGKKVVFRSRKSPTTKFSLK